MTFLLALHAVIGAALFPAGRRLGRRVFALAAIAPLATFVWLLVQLPDVVDGAIVTETIRWAPELGLDIELRMDGFAMLMALLVSAIGIAVCAYSARYFSASSDSVSRTAGLLVLFAGAMLCVVVADNLLVLYTGWELTSITSYLLIGNDHTRSSARAAALQALLITSLGGLVMLAGFVLIGQAAGTFQLSEILASPPGGTTVTVALVLIAIGAFTKSAQYPFHSWLPGAMAAPTPVSAYLHSATMVKAGVYLIGRFAPAFALNGAWRPMVLSVGVVTMIAGGLRALRQTDLKLLLAFGTVSQLGFLVVLFGIGVPEATVAGCAMLAAHAVFKATLFMIVGIVDHKTGTRDLRMVPRLGAGWRPFAFVTIAAAASMAGVPLLFGFIAKEAAFESLAHSGVGAGWLIVTGVVVGSALTVAYTARFLWGIFGHGAAPFAFADDAPDAPPVTTNPRPPTVAFLGPAAMLAAVSLVVGVVPMLADSIVDAAASALDASAPTVHLALWHGVNVALVLSIVAFAAGGLMFVARRPFGAAIATGGRIPSGSNAYLAVLRDVNTLATRVTGIVQNGSLPIYAGVTVLTAALVPGIVLLTRVDWPGWPGSFDNWAQIPIVVGLLTAAIASAAVRRRFSAALFLGTVGYAMAGLFIVQGAPDLALTQVAIETLSTVLFVLVLRRLPDRFERTSTSLRRVVRVLISAAVGVTVFVFAIVASASREADPVSQEMIDRSLPDAHGRNVVNVILVDIRGFDTMGEITVLASAGIGAVALARVGLRRRDGARSGARS